MGDSSKRYRFLILYADAIFWSMGEGSGAVTFTRTPRAMVERGHEVHLVLPAEKGVAPGVEDAHGVQLHRYHTPIQFHMQGGPLPVRLAERFIRYGAYQIIGYRACMAVARRFPPDLVLAYGNTEAPAARWIARRFGVPNVTRLFGTGLLLVMKNRIKFALAFHEVISYHVPCAKLILTNDGSGGEQVAKRCGVPPERLVFLRNGLDFERFSPGPADARVYERIGVPEGTPIIMAAARFAPEKKLERLVEAMPAVLRRVPNAVAMLVGDGPEKPRLLARARALGVEGALRFPGPVRNEELPPWYRTASIAVSLLDRTNANNPVFEAMACGRCVVAIDVATAREVVVPNETGVLVPPDDLMSLGDAIADVLLDAPRREAMGRAARIHIQGLLLDIGDRMQKEVEILERIIEDNVRLAVGSEVAQGLPGHGS